MTTCRVEFNQKASCSCQWSSLPVIAMSGSPLPHKDLSSPILPGIEVQQSGQLPDIHLLIVMFSRWDMLLRSTFESLSPAATQGCRLCFQESGGNQCRVAQMLLKCMLRCRPGAGLHLPRETPVDYDARRLPGQKEIQPAEHVNCIMDLWEILY
jgi:hypothetical protein